MWARLLAQHAARGGYEVVAYNRTPVTAPDPLVRMVPLAEIGRAGIVFICTAISSLPTVLSALRPLLSADSIVCDTCSVKERPQRWMQDALPKQCALLGTHPMFGPDSFPATTRPPIVYCPIRISEEELQRCVALFHLWGLRGVRMTARQHDKMTAYSQGFTHLVGRIAQRMQLSQTDIATLGYQRLLQVMEQTCKDSWDLFIDLQRYNRYTARMFSHFSAGLRALRRKVMRSHRR